MLKPLESGPDKFLCADNAGITKIARTAAETIRTGNLLILFSFLLDNVFFNL